MKYLDGVTDKGIVLSPSAPGEPFYKWDGGGCREAVLNKVGDTHYLNYDAAMPGKTPESYWNASLAKSTDLVHWEKLGPCLLTGALLHPEADETVYKDFRSASSPWSRYEDGVWYHFYVGADHDAPDGTPAFAYSTMLATSATMEGLWDKHCEKPGCEKHVCLTLGQPGSWNDATASPGEVLLNPRWATDPEHEKKYLMFYSGSCTGVTMRSLGIARTNDLSACDDYDKAEGNFWEKDPEPILPPTEDIENTSIFYEESSGLYWMFTNHIHDNAYTNAVWVYWSPDPEHWDPNNKAVAVDASVSSWAKGAIGMPAVIRTDENTLALLYDAVPGEGTGHLDRHIGMVHISLPLRLKDE